MGLLSRRRKQPRVVKKNKKIGQKKINIKQLDPYVRVSAPLVAKPCLETLGPKEDGARKLRIARAQAYPEPVIQAQ